MDNTPDFVNKVLSDQSGEPETPDFVDKALSHAPQETPDFVDNALNESAKQEKFGTPVEQTLAGAEGLLRGGTLGASDIAETKLLGVKPEDIKARQEANPWTSGIGNVVGGGALIGLTGGLAGPAEVALGGGKLASAIGFGAENAVFGAGQELSDYALGDPSLNAQKVAAHIGFDALLGAGFGVFSRPFRTIGEKAVNALEETHVDPFTPATPEAPIKIPLEDPIQQPKTFEEWEKLAKNASDKGQSEDLPQKAIVEKALERNPDVASVILPQQLEALKSAGEQYAFGVLRQTPNAVGKLIQNLEAGVQKPLINRILDRTIKAIAPWATPITDDVTAGELANSMFTKGYQRIKQMLGPAFEQLDNINLGSIKDEIQPLMEEFEKVVPGISQMFKIGEDPENMGQIIGIVPHNSGWGVTKAAYNAVKKVFTDMSAFGDENASFKTMMNFRKGMNEALPMIPKNEEYSQVKGLMKSFMDYMGNIADDLSGEAPLFSGSAKQSSIRDLYAMYAKNEQNREIIEKIFKGSVGNERLGQFAKTKPQHILDRIFDDPMATKAAREILSPKDFQELLMHHIAAHKEYLTSPEGVLSYRRLFGVLKNKAAGLNEAFIPNAEYSQNPAILQKLRDLLTIGIIIPDASKVNPSGTAPALFKMVSDALGGLKLSDLAMGLLSPKFIAAKVGAEMAGNANKAFAAYRADKKAIEAFNNGMLGKKAQASAIQGTGKMLSIINTNIDRAARGIFQNKKEEE